MEVLIVEDDLISRSLLKKVLTQLGHQTVEAGNGKEAWRLLKRRTIQMVITDWMMPEMDGIELCRNVRGERFDHYIYIIVVTYKDHRKDLIEVFTCGADDCITKPFDPEELKARLMTGLRVIDLEERHKSIEHNLSDEDKGEQLRSALEELEKTQAQMFHSEKMASIGQLAAGVAHEINNPTGFISSNLKTLQGYQIDIKTLFEKYRDLIATIAGAEGVASEVREAIGEIAKLEKKIDIGFLMEDMVDLVSDCREGSDRIKKIVLDLKAFAHPGDDTIQSIDLNSGLQSTLNVVHNQLKYKAIVEKTFGEIPTVRGCPQHLNQVFMNILINAVQAIEKRGVIHVVTRAVEDRVEVSISDDGCGIPSEHLTKIFDPFFTTKEVGKGTGLGMNIAYTIIKKHNGTIDVQSELGKGTTFTICLPVDTEDTALDSSQNLCGARTEG